VAIKVLHPEYAKNADVTARFFNEARAVNRIEHPGLVQISDYAQLPDGTAYLVMEYLKGESLAKRLERGRLAPDVAVRIAVQVADALSAAHEKNIVHRDLKPDNVMMVADAVAPGGERAKLLDFGIAKLVEAAKSGQIKTRTDMIMGTPLYMSPEQCRGAGEVDEKSDVYSLGVMLYEMLSGRGPFEANGHGEMIARHLFTPPHPLSSAAPDIPSELAAFVHRLLAKERAERPPMRTVYLALSELAEGKSLSVDLNAKSIGFAPTLPQMAEGSGRRSTTLGESASQSLMGSGPSRSKRVLGLTMHAGPRRRGRLRAHLPAPQPVLQRPRQRSPRQRPPRSPGFCAASRVVRQSCAGGTTSSSATRHGRASRRRTPMSSVFSCGCPAMPTAKWA
jgi:serine/threonine-protein kinase